MYQDTAGPSQATEPAAKSKTILIVEDELPFRQIYSEAFHLTTNHKVVEAEDGEEALEMVRKSPPDIILLDLILPKMNGFDVLAQLKNDPKYQHIPIVVYSVMGAKTDIDKALKLGANDFTIKGVTPATDVVKKVEALLASAESQ